MTKNEKILLGIAALAIVGGYFYLNRGSNDSTTESKSSARGTTTGVIPIRGCKKRGQRCNVQTQSDDANGNGEWHTGRTHDSCRCQ